MSVPVLLAVGGVGGIGAILRFLLDGAVCARVGREFPYGTLLVNLTGAFILGLLVGVALDQDAYRIAGTGLIGRSRPSAPGPWKITASARTGSSASGS